MDEQSLADLELQNEAMNQKLSIEEKRALIAEAKRRHGKDWSKFLGNIKSGMDWDSLKFKLGE
jgi:hypothetical protein